MTKARKSISSPVNLPKLLPEVRRSQDSERVQPVLALSPVTYPSPRNTLFRRTGQRYATTSFSAVFHENQAQIGPDLLAIEDDGLDPGGHVADDPIRLKLAVQTLQDFPTHRTCERLLVASRTMYDVWLSPKMITHCLKSVWSTFGDALKDPRSDRELSSMAHSLFRNGETPARPDEEQAWVNWFCGSSLRWEMIGLLFTFYGLVMMQLQDWDPIFNLPEQRGRTRKSASLRMKQCADVCLSLRNTVHPINDAVVCLFKNTAKLYGQVAGDECDEVSMSAGLLILAYMEAGLHRLPESPEIEPHSEFRKTLSASAYYLEKSDALFKARPPILTRFYCSYQIPLDLTEDELYGSRKGLAIAVSQLDKDGWNTCGRISAMTYFRASCVLTPIREEILEISLGINMQAPPGRIDQLLEKLSDIVSSYPPWVQYCNISQWSQPSFSSDNNDKFYLVTRIHAEVLQTKFLLQRLKHSSSSTRKSQAIFDAAQELMAITLSLWLDRDRLYDYQYSLHWMAVDYGIPAAGVLCVELLYAARHPHATDTVSMSRSDTIQSLIIYIALLDWVRPNDGNYELCRKLRKVIRNILDHVLGATDTVEKNQEPSNEYESVDVDQFDLNLADFGEQDWMSLLNTMDWTQGFEMETNSQGNLIPH